MLSESLLERGELLADEGQGCDRADVLGYLEGAYPGFDVLPVEIGFLLLRGRIEPKLNGALRESCLQLVVAGGVEQVFLQGE